MIKVGILTVSDKGFRGERKDTSGALIGEMVEEIDGKVERYTIVPDEEDMISKELIEMSDVYQLDLIFTTGGTGFSVRDVTPEATLKVIEKEALGIAEAMRFKSLQITPKAMLSRAVAGIRKKSLIINLPGSEKAVKECLEFILPALPHGIGILKGEISECGKN